MPLHLWQDTYVEHRGFNVDASKMVFILKERWDWFFRNYVILKGMSVARTARSVVWHTTEDLPPNGWTVLMSFVISLGGPFVVIKLLEFSSQRCARHLPDDSGNIPCRRWGGVIRFIVSSRTETQSLRATNVVLPHSPPFLSRVGLFNDEFQPQRHA